MQRAGHTNRPSAGPTAHRNCRQARLLRREAVEPDKRTLSDGEVLQEARSGLMWLLSCNALRSTCRSRWPLPIVQGGIIAFPDGAGKAEISGGKAAPRNRPWRRCRVAQMLIAAPKAGSRRTPPQAYLRLVLEKRGARRSAGPATPPTTRGAAASAICRPGRCG